MSKLKILFDECLDRRLVKHFKDFLVKTVPEMGWAGLKNGELLKKAHSEFDVLLTNDQNLSFQQSLPKFDIAVLVLCPKSHQLDDLVKLVPKIEKFLQKRKPGEAVFIRA